MSLLKLLSPADYFTIANGVVGALGILYFIDGGDAQIMKGAVLLFIAILLDGLDGYVARRFGSKHNFGVYLDSMSDSISFCAAPAVFIYRMFYNIERGSAFEDLDNFLAVSASISIAAMGIVRLSIFSYFKENRLETFLGLPTPSMAMFIILSGTLFQNYSLILLPVIIGVGAVMLMNFPYPKVHGKFTGLSLAGIFFALIGAFLRIYNNPYYYIPMGITLSFVIIYLLSPIYYRKKLKSTGNKPFSELEEQRD